MFFLISGYFLYTPSLAGSYRRALKSIKSTVVIYLIISCFYWLWLLPNNGNLMNSWRVFILWLTTGAGFSGHLWYLVAMIEALLVLALIFRWGRGWMLWLFVPLFLFGLLGSQYGFLLTDEPKAYTFEVYNVVCYGLPCMAGGVPPG